MDKLLIIIDMQNDFIDGALANPAAQAIVPGIVDFAKNWTGKIGVTYDTHSENYLNTQEGKNLPVEHCIKGTQGWELNEKIANALLDKEVYFAMHMYPNGCHGLGLAEDRNDVSSWSQQAVLFLKNLGW